MRRSRDTIVAVGSPPGRSARGLIRLAGPTARDITSSLFERVTVDWLPHRLISVRLGSPAVPALLAYFPESHSYCGDETVELQLPGNPALLDRVLHACLDAGARLAAAGEFTFRAFLAGRIDLTQAEGIAATIGATSQCELRAATLLREGKLGQVAQTLVDRVGTQLALVEAGIDFTDQEDVVPIAPGALASNLAMIAAELDTLLARARPWGSLEALPRVVLVGPPSSGKSTLFNALLSRPRAVVSEAPGTTRDVLEESLVLSRRGAPAVEVLLVDIAGLDDPVAQLDHAAQLAAERAIARADLVIHIRDPLQPTKTATERSTAGALVVATKADLAAAPADVAVSARTGEGLDTLRSLIAERVGARGITLAGETLALQPRHEQSLRAAARDLRAAETRLTSQSQWHAIEDVELLAAYLRAALDALAGLGGTLTPDDIIGRVFATFCVGK